MDKDLHRRAKRDRTITVILLFLMVFVGLGFYSTSRTIYMTPITTALNIKRTLYSVNDSIRFGISAVLNIFFGAIIAKFGRKKMILAGFIADIIAMVIYSVAESVFVLYIGSVFLSVGGTFTSTSMVGSIVSHKFRNNAGKVMGIILSANGIGAALATQIMTPIIYADGNPFGYRNAFRLIALIMAVTCAVIIIFLREEPVGVPGEELQGEKSTAQQRLIVERGTISGKLFVMMLICISLTGLPLEGVYGVYAAHMADVGMAPAAIANIATTLTLCLTGSKFLLGALYDRFGIRKTVSMCYIMQAAALLLLAMLGIFSNVGVTAYAFAVCFALALPMETIMLPLITQNLVGSGNFNRMMGLLVSANTVGYIVGGLTINLCYDIFGSYRAILLILLGMAVALLVFFNLIINAVKREQRKLANPAE